MGEGIEREGEVHEESVEVVAAIQGSEVRVGLEVTEIPIALADRFVKEQVGNNVPTWS
jgi:hypothetical protein